MAQWSYFSDRASTCVLTAVIASTWVGVAQFARRAELAPGCDGDDSSHGTLLDETNKTDALTGSDTIGAGLGPHSCAHFIVWLNGSSWMALGLPWLVQTIARHDKGGRWKWKHIAYISTPRPAPAASPPRRLNLSPLPPPRRPPPPYRLVHVVFFFVVALFTNYCYIAALEFIPASLNTAVFSTTSIMTLAMSGIFLPDAEVATPRFKWTQWIAVLLSCLGIALISQPWTAFDVSINRASIAEFTTTVQADTRLVGCALSLVAAAGTASYQVTFKWMLGDRLKNPVDLGLFMAKLGMQIFIIGGFVLWGAFFAVSAADLMALLDGHFPTNSTSSNPMIMCSVSRQGVYQLALPVLPYVLLCGTAIASLIFNFIIKFGLSINTPVVISLATQLGIPLNLLIDLLLPATAGVDVDTEGIDPLEIAGIAFMVVSFSFSCAPLIA
eukprot:SAG31_NODE_5476_length_2518_cov_1.876395_2_plen_441_part_00